MKYLRYLRNFLAVVGLISVALAAYLYLQGLAAVRQLDPKAPQVFGEFARRALEQDVASAAVVKLPLAEGVDLKEAAEAMELRANLLNIRLVGRLPYYEAVRAGTGKAYPYLEIFQFCDAGTAAAVLDYNRDFAAFMPCSIALYEDADGNGWLVTMNLDMLIFGGRELAPELKDRVVSIKQTLLDIMTAGATGAL